MKVLDEGRFIECWSKLGTDGPRGDLKIVKRSLDVAYNDPSRFYHNLDHIRQGLIEIDKVKTLLKRPEEVEVAWYFHDAVYDAKAKDNEERSAWLAHAYLAQQGVKAEHIFRIDDMILATRHIGILKDGDEKFLVDIDLSILGQNWDNYEIYRRSIGQEYSFVPEDQFRAGRSKVLEGFLVRPSIYQTSFFRDRYELRARENLKREIELLK